MSIDGLARATNATLAEVASERLRQERRWGEQNHAPEIWLMILAEEVGEAARAALDALPPCGNPVAERLRIERLREYRKELIQVAAVAVAAVESLDRNELREADHG